MAKAEQYAKNTTGMTFELTVENITLNKSVELYDHVTDQELVFIRPDGTELVRDEDDGVTVNNFAPDADDSDNISYQVPGTDNLLTQTGLWRVKARWSVGGYTRSSFDSLVFYVV